MRGRTPWLAIPALALVSWGVNPTPALSEDIGAERGFSAWDIQDVGNGTINTANAMVAALAADGTVDNPIYEGQGGP